MEMGSEGPLGRSTIPSRFLSRNIGQTTDANNMPVRILLRNMIQLRTCANAHREKKVGKYKTQAQEWLQYEINDRIQRGENNTCHSHDTSTQSEHFPERSFLISHDAARTAHKSLCREFLDGKTIE